MTGALCFYCSWDLSLLPPGGDCVFQLDRDTKYNTACAQSVSHLSPVQRLTQSTYLSCFFITAGFPDYVSPPRGGDLPYHVLIREQHGTSGNLGHVSPRCSRRADRGERGRFGHMGGALELRVPSFTTAQCTAIIIHLWSNWDPPSELVVLSDVSQAAVNVIMWFVFFSTKAAKMANYAKCQILCNLLFAMFAILFISSRLGVYPVWWVLRIFYLHHHN